MHIYAYMSLHMSLHMYGLYVHMCITAIQIPSPLYTPTTSVPPCPSSVPPCPCTPPPPQGSLQPRASSAYGFRTPPIRVGLRVRVRVRVNTLVRARVGEGKIRPPPRHNQAACSCMFLPQAACSCTSNISFAIALASCRMLQSCHAWGLLAVAHPVPCTLHL